MDWPHSHWYQKLLSTTWSTSFMKYITPMPVLPIQRLIHRSPEIRDCSTYNPHNEWIITWDAHTSDIIYGKSITQTNHPGSRSITQIQHYIHAYVENFSPNNFTITNASTSRRITSFLRLCKGYSRHAYNVSNPFICTLYLSTTKLLTIKIQHDNNFLTPIIPVPREYSPMTLSIYNKNPILNPLSPLYIKNLVIGFDQIIDRLLFLAHQFINFLDLSFYTDGSLFQEGPRKSIMSFAWIETTMSSPIPFQGATMFQPSSTTAETFAVLTVLMVFLVNSCINIFMDSLNTIHNYHKFSQVGFSTRQKLKFTTYPVWSLLIEQKHLTVTFTKVKSHSENVFND
ncbi:hypothetical protein RclHR1_00430008 [Rhizophagus clarus]|uniref:RNase H type-1 domain-containing protein n=1 Tax=Rhizophagus clarus TaxID=94130 RepID=A0A2Z6RI21_9GLOM|nr:hypothetical protein RclHR1_00430008 [Rhizophagus clarus]